MGHETTSTIISIGPRSLWGLEQSVFWDFNQSFWILIGLWPETDTIVHHYAVLKTQRNQRVTSVQFCRNWKGFIGSSKSIQDKQGFHRRVQLQIVHYKVRMMHCCGSNTEDIHGKNAFFFFFWLPIPYNIPKTYHGTVHVVNLFSLRQQRFNTLQTTWLLLLCSLV